MQRDGRGQDGSAEDTYTSSALSAFPHRLHDCVKKQQILISLSLTKDRHAVIEVTDLQALKDNRLLLGTSNDSYVGMGQVPVERTATATAVFSLKNLQKPHEKNNKHFLEEHIQSTSRSGLHYTALVTGAT